MSQRSFLKWAGNKYNCLKYLLPTFPQAKRLIEPFTGSATIFLNTNFTDNILAEENIDLINLFKSIKLDREDFIKYCNSFMSSMQCIKSFTNAINKTILFRYFSR